MLTAERHKKIASILREEGAVRVGELATRLSVSDETVRRDLIEMEKAHKLTRVHGGALMRGDLLGYEPFDERMRTHMKSKRALSRAAASLVKEGDVIALDSGSTANAFAETLRGRFSELTIVVNSLDVLNILAQEKGYRIILCGGEFRAQDKIFAGDLALTALRTLHVRKTFLFPTALSMKFGIFGNGEVRGELTFEKQLIAFADSVYVMADSSKFEHNGLHVIDEMRKEYTYVTDSQMPEGLRAMYRENQYQIICGDIEGN